MMSAHELPKLLTARRKAQRALADAECALDAAQQAYETAWQAAVDACSRYDEARAEVNDIAGSGS